MFDNQFKGDIIVKPLECPGCGKEIHSNYGYGDLIRKEREMIQNIHNIMSELATVEQEEAVVESFIPFSTRSRVYKKCSQG